MNEVTAVEPKKKRELVAVPPIAGGAVSAFIPKTIEEIKWEVGLLIEAGLAPDSFDRDPKKITIAVLKGLEVGMPPLMAVSNIAVIQGRAMIWGDAALALVQSKNAIERMEVEEIGAAPDEDAETSVFSPDYGFRVSIWRRGQSAPYVGKFTVGDAKRARLWMNPKKAPWIQHPKRMLKIRATAFPLRDGFADCLNGLAIREEIEDLPPTQEAKADTSFLDDAIPEKTIEAEPVTAEAPADAAPQPLPVPQGEGGADWATWQEAAEKIVGQCTSNTFLHGWVEVNKAALANFAVYSPTAHKALVQMIDGVLAENSRSAA
jgi:hypothetical protein